MEAKCQRMSSPLCSLALLFCSFDLSSGDFIVYMHKYDLAEEMVQATCIHKHIKACAGTY